MLIKNLILWALLYKICGLALAKYCGPERWKKFYHVNQCVNTFWDFKVPEDPRFFSNMAIVQVARSLQNFEFTRLFCIDHDHDHKDGYFG